MARRRPYASKGLTQVKFATEIKLNPFHENTFVRKWKFSLIGKLDYNGVAITNIK